MKFYYFVIFALCIICIQSQENQNQVVQNLIKNLQSNDLDVRREAIQKLADMQENARVAIPQLLKIANDEDWYIKRSAAKCLGKIGKPAAEKLIALLKSGNTGDIELAFFVLSEMEEIPQVETLIPIVIDALKNTPYTNTLLRLDIFKTLIKIGNKGVPYFIREIENSQKDKQRVLFNILGHIRPVKQETVIFLMKELEHNSYLAINALGNMEHNAKVALPMLIDIALTGDFSAIVAINKIGMEDKYILSLIEKLKNEKRLSIKNNILTILESTGPKAEKAIPVLIKMLQEKQHRNNSIGVLSAIGLKAVPALIEAINSPQSFVKESAITALTNMSPKPKNALSAVMSALNDQSRRVQKLAVVAVAKLGGDVKDHVEILIEASSDKDFLVSKPAVKILASMDKQPQIIMAMANVVKSDFYSHKVAFEFLQKAGKDAKIAVPVLIKLLNEKWTRNEYDIIKTLGAIGPDAVEAEPALKQIFTEKTSYLKSSAAKALAKVSQKPLSLVPIFIDALKEPTSSNMIRNSISVALGTMMQSDPQVAKKLLPLAKDSNKFVRQAVILAFTLSEIKPKEESGYRTIELLKPTKTLMKLLIAGLEDSEWEIRTFAATGLSFCGSHAAKANTALQKCLSDKNVEMRGAAAIAIAKIGLNTEQAIATLIKDLENPVAFIRMRTLEVLGLLEEKSTAAIPTILRLVENRDNGTAALKTLGRIKQRPDIVLPVLVKALTSSDERTRSQAARSIGEFTTDAKSTIPELTKALQDSSWLVRSSAIAALVKIKARTAISQIEKLMWNDPKSSIRDEAQAALESLKE